MIDPLLHELASRWGVQTGYWDIEGRWHDVDPDALLVVLAEVGAQVGAPDDAASAITDHTRSLVDQPVEPVMVVPSGRALGFVLRLPSHVRGTVRVDVSTEDGGIATAEVAIEDVEPYEGGEVDGRAFAVRWVDTGLSLPVGYHRVVVQVGGTESESLVLAPPASLPRPAGRTWGVFVPTYAIVPSGRPGRDHLGVAHLGHLDEVGRRVAPLGGSIVSTLPLLATYLDDPFDPSPYAPVSRRWWGDLHLDPSALPGIDESPTAQQLLGSSRVVDAAAALATRPLVDHGASASLMRELLDAVVADLAASRGPVAQAVADLGRTHRELGRYARFRAMVEQRGIAGVVPASDAPPADLDPTIVARHRYAQHAAEVQLTSLAGSYRRRGQLLALDLPLGAHPDGFDVWADPDAYAHAATGAPPDALFSGGQNWGFPPPHPIESRARGHRDFVAALRHHLRHAGLLRIDHLMSLERLWWIPDGFAATQGVYVRYPTDELMAIVAIEAERAGAVVVGENLGTVTDDINESMERWGMLGMYELQFEPGSARTTGRLRRPGPHTVASLHTHDMPTFAGWWRGADLDVSAELGLVHTDSLAAAHEVRADETATLSRALGADLGREVPVEADQTASAALEWLGRTEAAVVLADLEDLWLEPAPQNVPGTTSNERPNWQRRLARPLDEAFTEEMAAPLVALDEARRSAPLPEVPT
jgi:4-alpha-glucanotransferase